MLDACITSRKLKWAVVALEADLAANPNEVKFHMDRDQVAKCAQQCNMKKRMSFIMVKADEQKAPSLPRSSRYIYTCVCSFTTSLSDMDLSSGKVGLRVYWMLHLISLS